MKVRELAVPDAFELTPRQFPDQRGVFLEYYKADELTAALGHSLHVAQANCSVSNRGTLRGIHFADVPPGQAKYVTCMRGAFFDVVIDLRTGSPAFGCWDSVVLDEADRRAVYVAEGLGHALLALTDDATAAYLCGAPYAPDREHAVHPLDPAVGIAWPEGITPLLSARDSSAPTLAQASEQGLLPAYADCQRRYADLAAAR